MRSCYGFPTHSVTLKWGKKLRIWNKGDELLLGKKSERRGKGFIYQQSDLF